MPFRFVMEKGAHIMIFIARIIAAVIALAPLAAAARGVIAFDPEIREATAESGTHDQARNALSSRGGCACRIVPEATRSKCVAMARSTFTNTAAWAIGGGGTLASDAGQDAKEQCETKTGRCAMLVCLHPLVSRAAVSAQDGVQSS